MTVSAPATDAAAGTVVRPKTVEPIFVLGRQHSGNTMLATLLGRVPSVLGITGEGGFFEVRRDLDRLPPAQRADRTARRIRDDGVRGYLRDPDTVGDMGMWREVTPAMKAAAARGATATELYVLGLQHVLDRTGKERWAQKGTSYIFLADDILGTFPRARLIYLARNPLDLAASTQKRTGTSLHTVRLAVGWNRGVKRALRLQRARPDSLMVVRYEDLVREPEDSVRRVCAFCDLPYSPAYLDVPHVNKSDTPYNKQSEQRGLRASRVFYYRDHLSAAEEGAVRLAVDRSAFNLLYPELAGAGGGRSGAGLRSPALLAASGARLVAEEGRRLAAAPSHALRRVLNRVGVGGNA